MILTVFFSNIIELLIFTFFYKSLLSSNENKKYEYIIIYLLCFLIKCTINLLNNAQLNISVSFLMYLLLILKFSDSKLIYKLLSLSIYEGLAIFSESITYHMFQLLTLTNENEFLQMFSSKLFLFLFILLIKNYKYIVDEDYIDIKNSLLLSFQPLSIILFIYVSNGETIVNSKNSTLTILSLALLIISSFISFYIFGETIRKNKIKKELDFEKAEEIAMEFDRLVEMEEQVDVIEELLKEEEEDETDMIVRPPVVCVMGHVDHGKTSLLDKIRSSHVTTGEAGGITQHIGAYVVETSNGKITFLDTPGHEAFTSMRMRGAQSTDIAILVVAADDGVMPQTIEAINHAKAAGIEIIVAINKIDKESANIERVKQELIEYELVPEDWGGSTIFCPVSAHTGEGIDELLDMVSLTAEVLELKANPNRKARGIVLEAQLDKGRGPVATVLVQKGTLHVGDAVAIGSAHGKVRAMINDKGKRIKTAGPSTPVEILGLSEVPNAGEVMMVMDSEKEARSVAEKFIAYGREKMLSETKQQLSLDDLFNQIQAGSVKELNIIVKADVQGSVEAVKQSLVKLSNDEVAVKVIHGGVGAITESDVNLAAASNAIIIGFNVRPEPAAKDAASAEKVDLRLYRVIYNAIEDIEAAMKGMLDPEFVEKVTGHAEVRQIFKASGVGTIAGSYVLDGTIQRDSSARIIRDGIVVHEGKLASIQRGKDAVKEVRSGFECGLVMESYNDIKEGDQIESFIMEEVPR